jgi:(E)-4-hydroxy-3-methylbut-2-enyl-diphosphate synthase
VRQVEALAGAGSEIVRITVNDEAAARAVPEIRARLDDAGRRRRWWATSTTTVILLREYPRAAAALAKYRINPGNVGAGRHHDTNFATMIEVAKAPPAGADRRQLGLARPALLTVADGRERPHRAEPDARDVMIEAMLESALDSAEFAERWGWGTT